MTTQDFMTTRPRIAVFLPALHGGGAERTMLTLANGFADTGQQVDLVLAQKTGPYVNDISDQVRLVDLKASGTFAAAPALMRYLRREKPEAMVSALTRANIVTSICRRITGLPSRLVVIEQNTMSQWSQQGGWKSRMSRFLARQVYPWATVVGGVSQGVVDDLVDVCNFSAEQFQVLYNPGATQDVQQRALETPNHPWFAEGQPPVLVAVGKLETQKDFPTLLRAFDLVRQQREARLIILGEGSLRSELERLVDTLNLNQHVELPGFQSNPYAFMASSAAFVLSSAHEGLPTVLVEALTCGCRVVATDCPSGPHEILRGGELGPLVPVGNVARLSEAMIDALDARFPKPSREAWMPYTLDRVIESYLSVLLPNNAALAGT